ncbi:MAG: 4-hydroxy-3-methylbut-2-enyl diphosphate reductase [Armatimonadetes bacterium]|nr:4-hydroxy-3-methylbut-2-enyl diphosphate reductase [Armatimonadota bacterium]
MRILLAAPRGFCSGVSRAIDTVELALEIFGPPVYVYHEIVHNTLVLDRLSAMGARFVEDVAEVPAESVLILSAHGVSPQVREDAKARGCRVVDATCPLVTKVHLQAIRYAKKGYAILYVGHGDHPEARGVIGESPEAFHLVEDEADARVVTLPEDRPVVCLMQTTLSVLDSESILNILRERFPQMETPSVSDICYATTNRQKAARQMTVLCDKVVVVGSPQSSNSNRLVEVIEALGTPAVRIDRPEELDLEWLTEVEALGITSGASTPDTLVTDLLERIGAAFPVEGIEEVVDSREEIVMNLPEELEREAKARGQGLELVGAHTPRGRQSA